MQQTKEFFGKKVEDAVETGLKELGLTLDEAEIHILSNGGLFKKARIEIVYDDGKSEDDLKKEQAAAKKAAAKEAEKAEKATAKETPKAAAKESEKAAEKETSASRPYADEKEEPRWQSAPAKREPHLHPDFGKGEGEKDSQESRPKKSRPQKAPEQKKVHERNYVNPTPEQTETARAFMTELLGRMHIEGTVQIESEEGLRINIETDDARVIGHRGEVLDSFRQLVSALVNTSRASFVHVSVDGLGYRDRRKETLEGMAHRMAQKAVRTHRKVALDAMNCADRRIIHAALSESEDVFTRSEGHDPARRVVIIPKRKQAE